MTEIMVPPKTLDLQLVTAGEKKNASRWILPKFVKLAATDLHRFDLDWAFLGVASTQAKMLHIG